MNSVLFLERSYAGVCAARTPKSRASSIGLGEGGDGAKNDPFALGLLALDLGQQQLVPVLGVVYVCPTAASLLNSPRGRSRIILLFG